MELHTNFNYILSYAQGQVAEIHKVNEGRLKELREKHCKPDVSQNEDELQLVEEQTTCINLDSDDEGTVSSHSNNNKSPAKPRGIRCKTVTEINKNLVRTPPRLLTVLPAKYKSVGEVVSVDLDSDEEGGEFNKREEEEDKTIVGGILDDIINQMFKVVEEDKENRAPEVEGIEGKAEEVEKGKDDQMENIPPIVGESSGEKEENEVVEVGKGVVNDSTGKEEAAEGQEIVKENKEAETSINLVNSPEGEKVDDLEVNKATDDLEKVGESEVVEGVEATTVAETDKEVTKPIDDKLNGHEGNTKNEDSTDQKDQNQDLAQVTTNSTPKAVDANKPDKEKKDGVSVNPLISSSLIEAIDLDDLMDKEDDNETAETSEDLPSDPLSEPTDAEKSPLEVIQDEDPFADIMELDGIRECTANTPQLDEPMDEETTTSESSNHGLVNGNGVHVEKGNILCQKKKTRPVEAMQVDTCSNKDQEIEAAFSAVETLSRGIELKEKNSHQISTIDSVV